MIITDIVQICLITAEQEKYFFNMNILLFKTNCTLNGQHCLSFE